ncbi:DUF6790 family protein [Vallitalea okinawensis]|uniref:DUF6790 family protein n=1 Tax=Vallitalea okinawensis TaxID=2078660 RepID=UPI000CFB4AAE|nr:DUF6790 family protein [Vallitalea okinawensis]
MWSLYLYYIVGVMFILPVSSILIEVFSKKKTYNSGEIILIVIKWFVFWGIGLRCLTVGLSQSINPKFTASILQVSEESYVVIRELGFANICLGIVGIASLYFSEWRKAAACSGGIYLGIAGLLHISRISEGINLKEAIAMISDLFILSIVIFYMLYSLRVNSSCQLK